MRNNSLITRAKVVMGIIFKSPKRHICVMDCPNCGSINIEPLLEAERSSDNDESHKMILEENPGIAFAWSGASVCHSCGAVCGEQQIWKY